MWSFPAVSLLCLFLTNTFRREKPSFAVHLTSSSNTDKDCPQKQKIQTKKNNVSC